MSSYTFRRLGPSLYAFIREDIGRREPAYSRFPSAPQGFVGRRPAQAAIVLARLIR